MQVDPNNPDTVLWLQQSLLRVVLGRVFVFPSGEYDNLTYKAVRIYQEQNDLPVTGDPDAATITKIEQDIAQLDGQPYKMKRGPERIWGRPGDPVR
jgi:peptidoglycan hydrolase-like protein with peptidoglycan-binding domain